MAESNKERQPLADAQRRKNELIAELARARSGMSLHAGQVGYQTEFNRRVKTSFRSSFRQHFGTWLAGALVTGGFISMLPAREKKVYVNPLSKDGQSKLASPTGNTGARRVFPVAHQVAGPDHQTDPHRVHHQATGDHGGGGQRRAESGGTDDRSRRADPAGCRRAGGRSESGARRLDAALAELYRPPDSELTLRRCC